MPPLTLTALIYATLPVGPAVWRWIGSRLGIASAGLTVGALLAGAVFLGLRHRQALRAAGARGAMVLGLAALLYAAALARLPLNAAEKTHFVSYGLLALLVWRALGPEAGSPWRRSVIAASLVALAGLGDEAIQHLLPRRFFEWKDVGVNALSGIVPIAVVLVVDGGAGSAAEPPSDTSRGAR